MSVNYNSHAIKVFGDNDAHFLHLRDGASTVSGFGGGQQIHEMRYTDVATGLENQPIMIRALHVDVGGSTTGVGYKLGDLQTQVSDEANSRASAVSAVANNLADEVTRASNAESAVAGDLATESARALAAESDLSDSIAASGSNVTAEETRALAAEGLLADRLTYLEGIIAALVQ